MLARTARAPASLQSFVLHRYDWSESSLILDLFTREQGRLAVAAKGAKRPSSQLRSVLLPFQRLHVTLARSRGLADDAAPPEVQTLRAAEWAGGAAMLTGAALFAGFHCNELLMKLLARHDPHPRLFDAYAQTLPALASRHDAGVQAALRAFEFVLLKEVGVLPDLSLVTLTQRPLGEHDRYALRPEAGVAVAEPGEAGLPGGVLVGLQAALDHGSVAALCQACAVALPELKAALAHAASLSSGHTGDANAAGDDRSPVAWKLPMNPLMTSGLDAHRGHTALSVNLNLVALVRNRRPLDFPSVTRAATLVLEAGAAGITVHPRPDERHIRGGDVRDLAALLKHWPQAEFNIEGNPFHNLMDFVRELRPQQCTFVPDAEGQPTSDHGWDLAQDAARLAPLVAEARALGVRVSLFMDPEPQPMARASALGADRVELYTEPYAAAHGTPRQAAELARCAVAARAAQAAGLGVNAGHDLNRANLTDFLLAVPGVLEVSIGHALISDALERGYAATVRDYLRCIDRAADPARQPALPSR